MNDTERDLRELFESKARDAGAAPPVTREILRRGRRRQLGTVAVAGITTLAVAAAAVVSLQVVNRADTDSVPGSQDGNPAFTPTIQNFTLAVPEGWTLIDMTPLAALIPVGSETHFSCAGTPIEAGSGKNAETPATKDDCTQTEVQGTDTGSIPRGGLPMLTLSNQDPGLGGVACNASGSLPATSATLYIGLDYDALRVPGVQWESEYPVDRGPLTNVLEGDVPIDQMPCGPGGYSRFQAGGMPFMAWAGFGSDVNDADRQAIIDTFDGMQLSDAEISPPSTAAPGYVLTGGSIDNVPWTLQATIGKDGPQMAIAHTGNAAYDDSPASFVLGSEALQPAATVLGSTRISWGAVAPEAEGVEFRPEGGGAAIEGTLLTLPGSLAASYDAFVVLHDAAQQGRLVAIGPDGEIGGADTVGVPQMSEPTLEDRQVQSDLRNAYVAAKTYYTDNDSYEGFDPQVARSFGTNVTFNASAQAIVGEVSIRDVAAHHIAFAEATEDGNVLCIAENDAGMTTYGAVDAQTVAECVGGEAAWGQGAAPTETPSADPPAMSSVDLEGFASPTTLVVNGGDCLSIEVATDSTGSGICPHMSDRAGTFATIIRVGNDGLLVLVGFTGENDADQVFLDAENGTRTLAPILYTLRVAPDRRYFAFPVEATRGTVHIEDVNGNQLTSPIPVKVDL